MTRHLSYISAIVLSATLGVGCSGDSTPGAADTGTEDKQDGADATAPIQCITVADDLIADFATDNGLHPADGRQGGFYVYGDPNGIFDPPKVGEDPYPTDPTTGNPNCANGGTGAGSFHTKATGFSQWGAAMGTDFKPMEGSYKGTYDASKYKGVSFWAKAGAALTGVQVSFKDIYTDDKGNPNSLNPEIFPCAYITGATNNCSPYLVKFGDSAKFPDYAESQIDTEWKRFDIYFEHTQQDQYNPGFHTEADKVDLQHLTGMAVQVNANFSTTPTTPNDFELWIDDVYFIR